jgi:uncharacterized membrane protein
MDKYQYSVSERLALFITRQVGSFGFFLIIFIWTISWLTWNLLGPKEFRFDPAPAFVLWLFISNMIQMFITPLIMVGQNLLGRNVEYRAQSQYDMVEKIMQHTERQNALTLRALKRLEQSNQVFIEVIAKQAMSEMKK